MPNKVRRKSVVDLLAKVPVNRGSLLTSIENLLKTIESSESAVMIPTLLRDKCEFDAWELLFVAKILKASILGHTDLVEFYMNHMSHSAATPANTEHQQQQQQQHLTSLVSPSASRQAVSPILTPLSVKSVENGKANSSAIPSQQTATSPSLSHSSSLSSMTTAQSQQVSSRSQQSSASWTTANNGNNISNVEAIGTDRYATNSNNSSIGSLSCGDSPSSQSNENLLSTANSSGDDGSPIETTPTMIAAPITTITTASSSASVDQQGGPTTLEDSSQECPRPCAGSDATAAISAPPATSPASVSPPTRPTLTTRQAQPPSLLQLTTTNNHINSVAAVTANLTNDNIEQLTNQLTSMQANGWLSSGNGIANLAAANNSPGGAMSQLPVPAPQSRDGALSISTSAANQQSAANGGAAPPPELRTSRSAGCLFRMNSGASSPRTPIQTPTTPYPQAETLAGGLIKGLSGDPSAPVKLLLQIEQLKSSISHVTSLLESVVELYKKSIDNIALE